MTRPSSAGLRLSGVDHLAQVTWKPAATSDFYTRVLDMPLVHAITATGWLKEEFPDFVHFFFEMGRGSFLAFFYFFGLPEEELPGDLMHRSRHLAFHVDTEEELTAWRALIRERGVRVTRPMQHELLESIYFDDPNGIQLEIARPLRSFGPVDARDAELTLRALSDVAKPDATVQDMWHRKGEIIRSEQGRV